MVYAIVSIHLSQISVLLKWLNAESRKAIYDSPGKKLANTDKQT